MPVTALLDANVLYPAGLRDLLMQLAILGAFRARWTHQIHNERRVLVGHSPSHKPRLCAAIFRHALERTDWNEFN